MTEELLIKKAEEYGHEWGTPTDDSYACCRQGFIDGYHECQKEHEWHYVKDGDLPKNENRVLLYFGVDDYFGGQFIRGSFWCGSCGWIDVEEVVAWKEIVPPELKEIE